MLILPVTLMGGIAQNHPFRAGAPPLDPSGWALDGGVDSRTLADGPVGLIEHRLDEADLAAPLRPHVRPRG